MVHICRRGPPDGYEVEGRERTGDQETQPRLAGKDGSQGKGGRQNQTLIKPVVKPYYVMETMAILSGNSENNKIDCLPWLSVL